jgi:hypothetical protein
MNASAGSPSGRSTLSDTTCAAGIDHEIVRCPAADPGSVKELHLEDGTAGEWHQR